MGDDPNMKTETSNVLIGELPTGGGAVRPPSTADSSSGSGLGFTPTGNVEQDWVNLLMLSPLFKQISDLEEMLEKSDLPSDQPVRPHVKGWYEVWQDFVMFENTCTHSFTIYQPLIRISGEFKLHARKWQIYILVFTKQDFKTFIW